MRFPAAQGSLQVAKCSPAAARTLPGGTWRGPGGFLRHPKSTPWSPKSGQGDPIGCQEAPRSTPERQKRRQKCAQIAFRMENVDFLTSMLFPRKKVYMCMSAGTKISLKSYPHNLPNHLRRHFATKVVRRDALERPHGGSDSPRDAQRTSKRPSRRFLPRPLVLILWEAGVIPT